MIAKKQRLEEKKSKKLPKKLIQKGTHNDQMPVKYILQHLNCPLSIFDFRQKKFIYVNQQFTQITGIPAEECYYMDLDEFLERVQSTDLLALQDEIKKRLKKITQQYIKDQKGQLSYTMNCRFKQRDGNFSDIMVQCTVIEWDKDQYPAVTLNIYTDLSHHKRDLKVVLSISVCTEPDKLWETVLTEEFLRVPEALSKREVEIMKLMAQDSKADKISECLGLKFYTVRAHWRNILSKTGCHSQKELKQLAQKEGWV